MVTADEDVKPVVWSRKRRQKQKYCSPIDDDDSSSDVLEQSVTSPTAAGRCLRSRDSTVSEQVKKRRGSLDVNDNDKDDEDYEPEAVSRPKRRKRRRY